jgi:hypothetical protein
MSTETLTWQTFERYLSASTPCVLSMGGSRGVRLGYDPAAARMYVRLPSDPEDVPPVAALAEMSVERAEENGRPVLEIATASERFFREFHRFAGLLTEDFEGASETAISAFSSAVRRWQDFVSPKNVLTEDQQLGLAGELLMLTALMREYGAPSVNAWIASDQDASLRHDFRIEEIDIEVKATKSSVRRHFIHGLEQLVPAHGHDLYILSLRLEDAGMNAGASLVTLVEGIRTELGTKSRHRHVFEAKLASREYDDNDAGLYLRRLVLADAPRLIMVDDDMPRITSSTLEETMNSGLASRIDRVSYRVNLEGMGVPEGSREYEAVLPGLKLSQL